MPIKEERFVVRICGCCRGLDFNLNLIAESRVHAIMLVEKMGDIGNRATVRKFLENAPTDANDSGAPVGKLRDFYFYSNVKDGDRCLVSRTWMHGAHVWSVDE